MGSIAHFISILVNSGLLLIPPGIISSCCGTPLITPRKEIPNAALQVQEKKNKKNTHVFARVNKKRVLYRH